MVWIPLSNSSGQVVKGITVKAPIGGIVYKNGSDIEIKLEKPKTFTVTGSSPKVNVALSIEGKTLAPTPVAGLKVGRESDAAVSKEVKLAPLKASAI